MDQAEKLLIRQEQKKLDLKKYDALCPYVDEEGLVRVGGRLKNLNTKLSNPVLLPKGHLSTIGEEHIRVGHMGTEYVIANLRAQGYQENG